MREPQLALLVSCASVPEAAPPPQAGSDEFDIEATVLAVYNVISGPAGRRDWKRFEALFAPDARMVVASPDGPRAMTTKDYVDRATPRFNEKGFFERPVATRILRYGNIAHVWSTYESFLDEPRELLRGLGDGGGCAAAQHLPLARLVQHAPHVRARRKRRDERHRAQEQTAETHVWAT